jgi:Fe-Mn family superoxide dismutase
MAFELPDLPYAHDALASKGMSAETLEFHHDLHHNAYVTNGNKAIEGTEWEGKSLEDIITGTYDANAVAQSGIFNNISQLWNHNQFWEMMGPNASAMPSELEKRLWRALVQSTNLNPNSALLAQVNSVLAGHGW